jgi:hypothetical protein
MEFRKMRTVRTPSALLISAVLVLAACSDQGPTAPTAAPRFDAAPAGLPSVAGTNVTTVDVLRRSAPLAADITVSRVIGQNGGALRSPLAGITVTVPRGALSAPTAISVTAIAGDLIAYEFGPHGTVFNVPLRIEQRLSKAERTRNGTDHLGASAGHFLSAADIDFAGGRAAVNEQLDATVDVRNNKVTWNPSHFSGYLLASGRKGSGGAPAADLQ